MTKISFITSGESDFKKVLSLRKEVLNDTKMTEQDTTALHAVASVGDVAVACASLYRDGESGEIVKICVLPRYRLYGFGKKLVTMLAESGASEVDCVLPLELLRFAERCGFSKTGVGFKKDGVRYIRFRKSFVFRGARWLNFGGETEAVIARRDFTLTEKKKTELLVSGLGFCEIYVNGKSVSDRLLAPAWTNYVKRDLSKFAYPMFDTLTYRIPYERIDITELVKKGENTIVFHIGGGWFCQHESRNEDVVPYGTLTLCYKLLQGEKTVVVSDDDTRYRKSFVTRANIYFGEKQDARLGGFDFADTSEDYLAWKRADIADEPLALFSEQNCPSDRVIETLKPKLVYKFGDFKIYDIGKNTAGVPVITLEDEVRWVDETVTLRFSERLNDDGSLDLNTTGGSWRAQRDEFIFAGNCRSMFPRFTWHGARFVEVTGKAKVSEFRVIHIDIKKIVDFKSSNETLQWIFDAYVNSQLTNIHCCVPSDCPHRERLGYTGDGQLTCRAVMTVFDARELYKKWMRDIADSQDVYTGHVEHTAPFYGGGGGPGGWGGAMVFVPYNYWKFYGDTDVLNEYYENMLFYLEYMNSHSVDGLVTSAELGGWCLGDWCSPKNRNLIPPEFVNTCFHIKALDCVIEIAGVLKKDSKELKARRAQIVKSFKEHYFDSKSGTFCGSKESSDAYAFDLGLGNAKTLKAIVKKYTALGEFDTGIFGTALLIKVLCENGEKDLAFKLLTSEKENTFYNMKRHGATTLWETWDGHDSNNHPMFGAIVEQLVEFFNEAK